jgi:hypothetical protein
MDENAQNVNVDMIDPGNAHQGSKTDPGMTNPRRQGERPANLPNNPTQDSAGEVGADKTGGTLDIGKDVA